MLAAWQVPGDADGGQLTLGCYFDQTGSTDVQVTPAAAAQQDLIPNTEDDVVDEFAAGDAAPQVEAQHQRNGVGADSSVVDDGLIDEFAAGDAAVQIEVSCTLQCLVYMLSMVHMYICYVHIQSHQCCCTFCSVMQYGSAC